MLRGAREAGISALASVEAERSGLWRADWSAWHLQERLAFGPAAQAGADLLKEPSTIEHLPAALWMLAGIRQVAAEQLESAVITTQAALAAAQRIHRWFPCEENRWFVKMAVGLHLSTLSKLAWLGDTGPILESILDPTSAAGVGWAARALGSEGTVADIPDLPILDLLVAAGHLVEEAAAVADLRPQLGAGGAAGSGASEAGENAPQLAATTPLGGASEAGENAPQLAATTPLGGASRRLDAAWAELGRSARRFADVGDENATCPFVAARWRAIEQAQEGPLGLVPPPRVFVRAARMVQAAGMLVRAVSACSGFAPKCFAASVSNLAQVWGNRLVGRQGVMAYHATVFFDRSNRWSGRATDTAAGRHLLHSDPAGLRPGASNIGAGSPLDAAQCDAVLDAVSEAVEYVAGRSVPVLRLDGDFHSWERSHLSLLSSLAPRLGIERMPTPPSAPGAVLLPGLLVNGTRAPFGTVLRALDWQQLTFPAFDMLLLPDFSPIQMRRSMEATATEKEGPHLPAPGDPAGQLWTTLTRWGRSWSGDSVAVDRSSWAAGFHPAVISRNQLGWPTTAATGASPLRVALLCHDFRHHAVGYVAGALFEEWAPTKWTSPGPASGGWGVSRMKQLAAGVSVSARQGLRDYSHVGGLIAVSFGPNDGTEPRLRAEQLPLAFLQANGQLDDEVIASARSLAPHVALDMQGPTQGNRFGLLARRVAPVQASFMAVPGTSGMRTCDYNVVDRRVAPPRDAPMHSERLAMLPRTYQVEHWGLGDREAADGALAAVLEESWSLLPVGHPHSASLGSPGRRTGARRLPQIRWQAAATDPSLGQERRRGGAAGLPPRWVPAKRGQPRSTVSVQDAQWPGPGIVLANLASHRKLNPETLGVWCNILRQQPNAILWLLSPGEKSSLHGPAFLANVKQELAGRGVRPTRVVLAPRPRRAAHMRRLQLADLFLGTLRGYGSHSTAAEMLRTGLPVMAMSPHSAELWPTRVAGSLNLELGGPAAQLLTAPSAKSFELQTIRLVCRPMVLRALRRAVSWRIAWALAQAGVPHGSMEWQPGAMPAPTVPGSPSAITAGAVVSRPAALREAAGLVSAALSDTNLSDDARRVPALFGTADMVADVRRACHAMWEVFASGLRRTANQNSQPGDRASLFGDSVIRHAVGNREVIRGSGTVLQGLVEVLGPGNQVDSRTQRRAAYEQQFAMHIVGTREVRRRQ